MYILLLTNMFTYCKDVPILFIAFSFSYNRFMFFSDNNPNGRITRASLDGRNATVIVYRGLVRVSSLTVDPDNDLLLWADTVRFTVEMCQYDGSQRRVVRRANLVSFAGLQFYQVRSRDIIIPSTQ